MSNNSETLEKQMKVGASFTVEHKRGSGTRDQDKVKAKVHGEAKDIGHLSSKAVKQALNSMEDLREADYEVDEDE